MRPHRRVQLTRFIGLLFALAGFAAILVGWNGMAGVSCVDCQLPYLLSGGAAGLGLILVGVGLLVVAQLRAERIRIARHVDAVRDAIWEALQSLEVRDEPGAEAPHAPGHPEPAPPSTGYRPLLGPPSPRD